MCLRAGRMCLRWPPRCRTIPANRCFRRPQHRPPYPWMLPPPPVIVRPDPTVAESDLARRHATGHRLPSPAADPIASHFHHRHPRQTPPPHCTTPPPTSSSLDPARRHRSGRFRAAPLPLRGERNEAPPPSSLRPRGFAGGRRTREGEAGDGGLVAFHITLVSPEREGDVRAEIISWNMPPVFLLYLIFR
ncbi:Os01g0519301 [Oryza sativa Japonica Group]|uniref:Os01g0519301 protein n=1 Tax=Oryza sativa subsp. japonica TaxID=39947 RepID=A0A0P0V3P2_ORYSJ|nr:Os01g0519301 [Oryza sativa Japonica Group]